MRIPPLLAVDPLTAGSQVADQIVGKGFEWYFVALLVIGLIVIGIIAKYGWAFCQSLLSRITTLEDDRANDLRSDKKELVLIASQCSEALNRNAEAFLQLSETFKTIQHVIRPNSSTGTLHT